MDEIWEMDLESLSSLSKYNDKFKYLLNVTDIFSQYAWSIPLKDKTGASLHNSIKNFIAQ